MARSKRKYSVRYSIKEKFVDEVAHMEMYQYTTEQYNINAVMYELSEKLCPKIVAGSEIMAIRIVTLSEVKQIGI